MKGGGGGGGGGGLLIGDQIGDHTINICDISQNDVHV